MEEDMEEDMEEEEDEMKQGQKTFARLDFIRKVGNSSKKCVICDKENGAGCTKIPEITCIELLLDYRLLVRPNSHCRICKEHLEDNHLKDDLEITRNYEPLGAASLSSLEAVDLIYDLIGAVRLFRDGAPFDFSDPQSLSDEEYESWTGWSKARFAQFLPYLEKELNYSANRSLRDALAMFWIKVRADLSCSQIASLFGIDDPKEKGRIVVQNSIHAVADALHKNFVPEFLGTAHMTPENARDNHNTIYSHYPTTIWDGTYIYVHRSSNYKKGRKTRSPYKHRELIKFMSIVLPDGYVLDAVGPFFSDGQNSDSSMTATIIDEKLSGIIAWLKRSGKQVVIMDRGFKNVMEDLTKLGNIEAKMPSCNAKGKTQHSVFEANQSRLVTKVRWVVEAYHGRLKKFKMFENRQNIRLVKCMKEYLRITTAALNKFRPALYDTKANPLYHQKVANIMLDRSKMTTNDVAERVNK